MTFGLSNFGSPLESNICFINAILQLLYSVAIFRNLVKKKGYKAQRDSATPVMDEVSRIFNYQGPVTSAGPLRQLLGAKEGLGYLMRGEQEDASLFMRHLLEQILKEVSPEIKLEEHIANVIMVGGGSGGGGGLLWPGGCSQVLSVLPS